MKERTESFTIGDRPTVDVALPSGSVTVRNGADGNLEIRVSGRRADEFTIDQTGDAILVRLPARGFASASHRVQIVAPEQVSLNIAGGSADVTVEQARDLSVRLGSGDVKVASLSGDLTHKSASGDIVVGTVSGTVTTASASGDVKISLAEDACECAAVSGDIVIDTAKGDVSARAVSGDVRVGLFEGSQFVGKTTSGDIRATVPKGCILDVDLLTRSGRCSVPEGVGGGSDGPVVDILCKSMSGDVDIRTTK